GEEVKANPLWELFLFRMREFVREPAILFWAMVFPLGMMVVLGLAFRPQPPRPIGILIEVEPGDAYGEGMKKALESYRDDASKDAAGKPGPLRVIAKPKAEAALAL